MTTVPGEPAPTGGGLFFLRVNSVFLAHLVMVALLFIINVILFRQLGAEGKGAYTLFTLGATVVAGTSTLGVGLANIYALGRGMFSLRAVLAVSEFFVAAITIVLAGALAALALLGGGERLFGGVTPWLFLLGVPVIVQMAYVSPILQARNQFQAYNIAAGAIPLVTLAGVAALVLLDGLTTERALALWVAGGVTGNVIGMTAIGWGEFARAFPFKPSFPVLRAQVRFGLQGELGNVLQLVNYRFDQFVVAGFKGAAAVGYYSIAVAVAESLWLVSRAVVVVLTPRLTGADDDDAADFAPFVCRSVLLVNGLLALLLAAVAPFLIELAFGSGARRALAPTLWLLPGIVAMSGMQVMTAYIFSRGRPILNTYATATTVVATVVLDIALIPPFGIEGAAMASSLAYTATFAFSLYWFRRLSGLPAWTAVGVRPSDFRTYMDVLRLARRRVAGGT